MQNRATTLLPRVLLAAAFAVTCACQGGATGGTPPSSGGAPSTDPSSTSQSPPGSSSPSPSASADGSTVSLGANLPGIDDWMYTPVYVDLLNQARRFGTAAAPWDEAAMLGGDGWPVGDFGVVLSTGLAGYSGSPGTYKVLFDGRATVGVVASAAQVLNQTYDAARNASTAQVLVDPAATQLNLSFTQSGAGIRNLKVIRPGYGTVDPPLFTDEFLRHLTRFSTLRFMDWLRTNSTTVKTWSSRASSVNTHYASAAGVPWEHVMALANQTGKDIWINIPIEADDDYVLQLAQLIKTSLNPALAVYIEYSNEIWNSSFPQFRTNDQLARAAVRANPGSPLTSGGVTDTNVIALRHIGERLKRISDIFRGVYGNDAMMARIRPVLGAQVAQPYVSSVILSYISAVYGPPSKYFYGLAGAPYFNLGSRQTSDSLSVDQVLQAMDESIVTLAKTNYFETNMAQASWHGLRFLGYEGGSDTFGPGSLAAKKAASLDPRMTAVCMRYLSTWYASGGGLMMWYTAGAGNWDTQYGTWALTTDLALTDTPKIRCMDSALAGPLPAARARNVVPGSFDALAFVDNLLPYSSQSRQKLRYLHPGSYVDYLIFAPRGGTYSLTITAAAKSAGNSIDVLINGATVSSSFALANADWDTPVGNSAIPLTLSAGFNTLRILTRDEATIDGGYSLVTLSVQ